MGAGGGGVEGGGGGAVKGSLHSNWQRGRGGHLKQRLCARTRLEPVPARHQDSAYPSTRIMVRNNPLWKGNKRRTLLLSVFALPPMFPIVGNVIVPVNVVTDK